MNFMYEKAIRNLCIKPDKTNSQFIQFQSSLLFLRHKIDSKFAFSTLNSNHGIVEFFRENSVFESELFSKFS
jgi:hypothetical protein